MRYSVLIILVFAPFFILAQNIISPVRSQTITYSNLPRSIEKWTIPNESNLELHLSMLDVNVASATIKIKMILEFSGSTSSASGKIENPVPLPIPINITGGEETILYNDDLVPFFLLSNLSFKGYSFIDYQKNGNSLPDGNYTLRFEVYEYYSGAKVSRTEISARFYFRSADVPLITSPLQNEIFYTDVPLQFFFRWTPRHIGSAPGFTDTRYTLEVAQVPKNFSSNINLYFNTFPRIYEAKVENTYLYFDDNNAFLEAENIYAYRVRAQYFNGIGEELVLKNNGYSEVRTFSVKERCIGVKNLFVTPKEESALLQWTPSPNAAFATLYYRKKDGKWFEISLGSNDVSAEIKNLESGTEYQCKISVACAFGSSGTNDGTVSENGSVVTFQTTLPSLSDGNSNCGETIAATEKENDSLSILRRFDKVKTGSGLTISIEDVTGENGIFSGTGYTHIPLLANTGIKVTFKKVHINKNYQLVSGEFICTSSRRKL
jgi:hypothetical protein